MDPSTPRINAHVFYPNAASEPPRPAAPPPPVVSIVTRTKDRPILLHRAIASALSQRYPHWRMYIVNDGGNPSEVEAAVAKYARPADGRITVLHHARSLGMEAASNAALLASAGEYVAIHDDDDAWHPDFLATTVEFLDAESNRRFVGVVTNCRLVRERILDGVVIEESQSDWADFAEHVDFQRMIVQNNFPPICLLFRRSLLDRIGGFCEALPVLGDWEFNLRALMAGDLAVIGRQLAYYHLRIEDAEPAYSNTVTAGVDRHQATNVLIRNAVLRRALQRDPALMGVIQPLLFRIDALERLCGASRDEMRGEVGAIREMARTLGEEVRALSRAVQAGVEQARRADAPDMLARLVEDVQVMRGRIDEIGVVSAWNRKMLRPVHVAWRSMLPLRRGVARLRGRP